MSQSCTYAGVEYSEGAEVCQEGHVKKCSAGQWIDTSRDCESMKQDQLERILDSFDDFAHSRQRIDLDNQPGQIYTRYFDIFTISRGPKYTRFLGADSVADFCTDRNVRSIEVYTPNIKYISDPLKPDDHPDGYKKCPGPGGFYGKIVYEGFGAPSLPAILDLDAPRPTKSSNPSMFFLSVGSISPWFYNAPRTFNRNGILVKGVRGRIWVVASKTSTDQGSVSFMLMDYGTKTPEPIIEPRDDGGVSGTVFVPASEASAILMVLALKHCELLLSKDDNTIEISA